MKASLTLGFALCWFVFISASQAGTAQVQLANTSLRIYPGSCTYGFGLVFKMHFSTSFTEDPRQANGELARRPTGSPTTHWAYMLLEDPSMYTSTTIVEVDLPLKEDLDRNGIPDLLEPTRKIAMASSGTYYSDLGEGALSFSWAREAGTRIGACTLYLDDPILGRMGPFQHVFEIYHYSGSMDYQRTSGASSGAIRLKQDQVSAWAGGFELVRSPTDPFNTLMLQPGGWTNATETFSFEAATLVRDPATPAIYTGTLQNAGGTFNTWTMQVADLNDSNHNGIPDLSDDLVVQPPSPAHLTLRKAGSRLELIIEGESGRVYDVETTGSPGGTWLLTGTVTLTNASQAVELAAPAGSTAFWRVVSR